MYVNEVANPRWAVVLNQNGTTMAGDSVTIGVALVMGRRGLSLVWGRPKWVRGA